MYKILPFFCGLFICISSFAQTQNGEVLPVQFTQFYQNYSLVHPAATALEKPFQIFSGFQSQTGAFKGVNTTYFGGNFQLPSKDSLDKHALGVNVSNNREGYFFNRGRIDVSYAYHNRISSNWIFSAGISAGIIDYVYNSSNYSAGGSALKPNLSTSLFLSSPNKTHIGLTFGQLIPGNMYPLESQLKINPYMIFSADKRFYLSPFFSFMPAVIVRAAKNNPINTDVTLLAIVHDVLSAGLDYKVGKGYSVVGGVYDTRLGKYSFNFFLSYYLSFTTVKAISPSLIELTCIFNGKRFVSNDNNIPDE